MTEDIKICSKCHELKLRHTDFYYCKNQYRSECKACTIKHNVNYQRQVKAWKLRFGGDDEIRRAYMRDYYAENINKFAEYRENFRKKHPDYHREYYRNKKNRKD